MEQFTSLYRLYKSQSKFSRSLNCTARPNFASFEHCIKYALLYVRGQMAICCFIIN